MEEERREELPIPEDGKPPEEIIERDMPRNLMDEMEAARAEIEESTREKEQIREMLQRVQADFVNFRRRAEEEREDQQRYANTRLILKLLPVVDDFNLAIDHASESESDAPWVEGVRLIQRKLNALLESENVNRTEAEGMEFDPLEHEALGYEDTTDHNEGQIVKVVRDGYKMQGRVIRPALVILAKRPQTTEEETEDA